MFGSGAACAIATFPAGKRSQFRGGRRVGSGSMGVQRPRLNTLPMGPRNHPVARRPATRRRSPDNVVPPNRGNRLRNASAKRYTKSAVLPTS